jgi:hypothetical protein
MKRLFVFILLLFTISGFSQSNVESGTWVIWNNQAWLKSGSDSTLYGNSELVPYLQNIMTVVSAKQSANGNAANLTGLTPGQVGLNNVTNESKATMFTNPTFTGTPVFPLGSILSSYLANGAVGNLSGTNTGDNATNTNYATDYRAANFIAGTNYLAPNGSAAALTNFPTLNQNTTGTAAGLSVNIAQSQVTNLLTDLAAKQATLVSGVNIKTVNGNDITGPGNLVVTGGSGSPGGINKQLQYNDAGSFNGVSNIEVESGNLALIPISTPTPITNRLLSYSKSFAGRLLPTIQGPSGIESSLQVSLHGNSVTLVAPSNGSTAPTAIGALLTTAATISHQQTIASANPWLATRRTRYQTSTTAGNQSGVRTAYVQWFRSNAGGFGGFWFRTQIGTSINLNGGQKFAGLCAAVTALAGDPSALVNMCGVGYDAADASTGNWFFMRNDGSGTAIKVDLGVNAARNTTHGFDLIMFSPPNSTSLFVKITNIHTGTVVLDTSYDTDLPAVNTGLALKIEVRNGVVAAADNIDVSKIYIESDY